MIDGLRPYPKMKDSGVPWLGEVPEAWNVHRGRHLFEIEKRIAGELGYPVLSVTQTGLRVKDVDSAEGQVSLDYSKYQIVQPGDFIMNSMDLLTGGVGIADGAGVTSPDYRVFVIRDDGQCRDRYVLHVFRTLYGNRGFYAWGQGSAQLGRWRLPRKRFNEFPFPVPPLPEQAAIVRFVDHADRRIRRYIRAKQKLIKLLEEQKQAIIHRAVTRGLDPTVRLKRSGVEWLGDVPEHWEVSKLKHLTRFRNGLAFKPADWAGEGVPIIRIQNLNGSDQFNYTTRNDLPGDLLIRKGDLLFSWSGNRGTSFGPYMWDREFPGYLNQHIFKLEGYTVHKRYFAHLLRAVTKHIEEQTHGIIGLVHVTKPELGAVLVPVAPFAEQEHIAKAIDCQVASMDAICARARREIELLREFRTCLIADVVTGKLDVREAAGWLPDEGEEPEPLDEIEPGAEADEAGADDADEVPEEAEA